LRKADKRNYIIPLAKAFVKRGIIKLRVQASFERLSREDISKVGTF